MKIAHGCRNTSSLTTAEGPQEVNVKSTTPGQEPSDGRLQHECRVLWLEELLASQESSSATLYTHDWLLCHLIALFIQIVAKSFF